METPDYTERDRRMKENFTYVEIDTMGSKLPKFKCNFCDKPVFDREMHDCQQSRPLDQRVRDAREFLSDLANDCKGKNKEFQEATLRAFDELNDVLGGI